MQGTRVGGGGLGRGHPVLSGEKRKASGKRVDDDGKREKASAPARETFTEEGGHGDWEKGPPRLKDHQLLTQIREKTRMCGERRKRLKRGDLT